MASEQRIRRLRDQAQRAMKSVVTRVAGKAEPVGDHLIAWGQFLDAVDRMPQHGLYGTSAAIQILSLNRSSYRLTGEGLPWITSEIAEASHSRRKGDFDILYKAAFVMDALDSGTSTSASEAFLQVFAELGAMRAGQGWRDARPTSSGSPKKERTARPRASRPSTRGRCSLDLQEPRFALAGSPSRR